MKEDRVSLHVPIRQSDTRRTELCHLSPTALPRFVCSTNRHAQFSTSNCKRARSVRESRDELAAVKEALAGQAGELRALRARLAELEVPWLWRCGPGAPASTAFRAGTLASQRFVRRHHPAGCPNPLVADTVLLGTGWRMRCSAAGPRCCRGSWAARPMAVP